MGKFSLTRNGSQCTIAPVADLTAPAIPDIQRALLAEIRAGGVDIVFDFSAVRVLDSSGIGLLVAAHNSATRGNNGSISIENASNEIFQLLQSMRLVERLRVRAQTAGEVAHG